MTAATPFPKSGFQATQTTAITIPTVGQSHTSGLGAESVAPRVLDFLHLTRTGVPVDRAAHRWVSSRRRSRVWPLNHVCEPCWFQADTQEGSRTPAPITRVQDSVWVVDPQLRVSPHIIVQRSESPQNREVRRSVPRVTREHSHEGRRAFRHGDAGWHNSRVLEVGDS